MIEPFYELLKSFFLKNELKPSKSQTSSEIFLKDKKLSKTRKRLLSHVLFDRFIIINMNKTYTQQEVGLIKQALTSINQSLTAQQLEKDHTSPQWTIFKVLKVLYHIATNPTFTQKKCIQDLATEFQNKSQNSLKELIKRINSHYSKQQLLNLAFEMRQNPENINYIRAFDGVEVKKYMRRFREISKGLMNPPENQFEKIAFEFIENLNNIPIMAASDYRIEQILLAFPEKKNEFETNIARLQDITQESQESCVDRLIGCSLDLDLALRSLEDPKLTWDKTEDIQLIDSLRKKEQNEISLFKMYKGEESLEKRRTFLERLESNMRQQNRSGQ